MLTWLLKMTRNPTTLHLSQKMSRRLSESIILLWYVEGLGKHFEQHVKSGEMLCHCSQLLQRLLTVYHANFPFSRMLNGIKYLAT
jgi:hypothetical protein